MEHPFETIENVDTLEQAVARVLDRLRGQEPIIQYHELRPMEGFPVHRHMEVDELVVVYDASFETVLHRHGTEQVKRVDSRTVATVVAFPRGTCHTLRALEPLCYAVIKTGGEDDYFPCRGECGRRGSASGKVFPRRL